jgi:hypothetical protein
VRTALARLVLLVSVTAAACGPTVDLTKGLKVNVLETGWYDAGIINGQNKLVPTITLTLTNLSNQTLVALQVNGSFRRVTEPEKEWGSRFLTAAGSRGLAPGATSDPVSLRSELGYTGSDQSRQEMLQNSHFVDATVALTAKYSNIQWVRMGEFPIERKLLTK